MSNAIDNNFQPGEHFSVTCDHQSAQGDRKGVVSFRACDSWVSFLSWETLKPWGVKFRTGR